MYKRILIVGKGSIGQLHLKIVKEVLPESEVRIFHYKSDREPSSLRVPIISGCQELLDFNPQIAILANPSPMHVSTGLMLADLVGCHLLVEKPLSGSFAGAAALVERMYEKKLILQVAYNLRFLPSLQNFRQRILDNEIGEVLSVRCEVGQYLPSWRPTDYRASVSARAELGGGVLLELSHELDFLQWIFGSVEWVNAWVGRLSALEVDVEDSAAVLLGFAEKAPGRAVIATLNMDFIRHDATRTCTAIGDKGSIRWNGISGTVDTKLNGSNEWCPSTNLPHQREDSYRAQLLHFLSKIRASAYGSESGQNSLDVLRVIEACRESGANKGARSYIKDVREEKDS